MAAVRVPSWTAAVFLTLSQFVNSDQIWRDLSLLSSDAILTPANHELGRSHVLNVQFDLSIDPRRPLQEKAPNAPVQLSLTSIEQYIYIVLPLVRKFPYCKERSPFGRKKEGNENVRKKEGNFEASKELKRRWYQKTSDGDWLFRRRR